MATNHEDPAAEYVMKISYTVASCPAAHRLAATLT